MFDTCGVVYSARKAHNLPVRAQLPAPQHDISCLSYNLTLPSIFAIISSNNLTEIIICNSFLFYYQDLDILQIWEVIDGQNRGHHWHSLPSHSHWDWLHWGLLWVLYPPQGAKSLADAEPAQ